jgi:cobalt-zinc-cadmium efflux system protein
VSAKAKGAARGKRLLAALALNLGIAVAEVIGGLASGSLALLADAAHNLSDAGAVLVSWIAWRVARRETDRRRTFGYGRAETVGAVINLTALILIGAYLLYEAAHRAFRPVEVHGTTMLVVGAIALVEDLAAAWVLRPETRSLNIRSTYLHMIGDALATVGVILGALAIMAWGPGAWWVDPTITAAISIYILLHAWHEIREAIAILMNSAPRDFDYEGLVEEIGRAPGVEGVHHLHLWRPEEGRLALEAHVVLAEPDLGQATVMKEQLKERLRERFGIDHATIELELGGHFDHASGLFAKRQAPAARNPSR